MLIPIMISGLPIPTFGKTAFRNPSSNARFIQYLAQRFRQSIAIYQYYKDDKLVGAAFFRKDGNIHKKLLSEIKADYNFFGLTKTVRRKKPGNFSRLSSRR